MQQLYQSQRVATFVWLFALKHEEVGLTLVLNNTALTQRNLLLLINIITGT